MPKPHPRRAVYARAYPCALQSRQVPSGLDSRGFALHRIFCMAGEPRYATTPNLNPAALTLAARQLCS